MHSESAHNLPVIRESISLLDKTAKGIEFQVRPFRSKRISDHDISTLLQSRLTDPYDRDSRAIDSFALRDFERRALKGEARARGVPYEASGLMRFYRDLITGADEAWPRLHVVVTDRLLMSWSEDDLRYHARAVALGIPCIVSMSGLVEAPARPREYYLEKQATGAVGGADVSLRQRFAGRFLESDDDRTPLVLRGYFMQCLFYAMTGEPFCVVRDCMLFNAHWQEEMLRAQVESGRLCERHQKLLAKHLELLKRTS